MEWAVDLMEKKAELEGDLFDLVSARLDQFQVDTGVSISGMTVYFESSRALGDVLPKFIVGSLEVYLGL